MKHAQNALKKHWNILEIPRKHPWITLWTPIKQTWDPLGPWSTTCYCFWKYKQCSFKSKQQPSILKLFCLTLTLTLTSWSGPRVAFVSKNSPSWKGGKGKALLSPSLFCVFISFVNSKWNYVNRIGWKASIFAEIFPWTWKPNPTFQIWSKIFGHMWIEFIYTMNEIRTTCHYFPVYPKKNLIKLIHTLVWKR